MAVAGVRHHLYPRMAPPLLARLAAGRISCEQAMQIGFGGVSSPSLSVGKITVAGSQAWVIAVSTAKD